MNTFTKSYEKVGRNIAFVLYGIAFATFLLAFSVNATAREEMLIVKPETNIGNVIYIQ